MAGINDIILDGNTVTTPNPEILKTFPGRDQPCSGNSAAVFHSHLFYFPFATFIQYMAFNQYIYGSVSAGREFCSFRVIFFQKLEPSCDQT